VFLLGFHWNEKNDNHQYKTNKNFEESVMVITIVRAWAHGFHGVGYGSCDINNRAWQ
jgi:hypothetical protein